MTYGSWEGLGMRNLGPFLPRFRGLANAGSST
jgi:hypothetical protein